MARLLLFGPAREAAGTRSVEIDAPSLDALRAAAAQRFGDTFAAVMASASLWVNGDQVAGDARLSAHDEVAVVPPVSGG